MAEYLLAAGLTAVLASVTVSDLRFRTIPDRALLAGAAVAVAILAADQPSVLLARTGWAAAAGGFLLAAALTSPEGMGLGDVKLAALLGLYLGSAVAFALLLALGAGALWGAALIARHGWSARRRTIPFAPFLASGAAAAWVATVNLGWWN
jgi:leader peptidase (prepilin peptidase)/N-methyltransferase